MIDVPVILWKCKVDTYGEIWIIIDLASDFFYLLIINFFT